MVTIFGSERFGWNAQIDKREPIVLGFTRARAIRYAKELIDEEQAKYHSRSAGGASRNGKASSRSKRPNNVIPDRHFRGPAERLKSSPSLPCCL